MTPQELMTPELAKALGQYIPAPQRPKPPTAPAVSRTEGNASLLKIRQ